MSSLQSPPTTHCGYQKRCLCTNSLLSKEIIRTFIVFAAGRLTPVRSTRARTEADGETRPAAVRPQPGLLQVHGGALNMVEPQSFSALFKQTE